MPVIALPKLDQKQSGAEDSRRRDIAFQVLEIIVPGYFTELAEGELDVTAKAQRLKEINLLVTQASETPTRYVARNSCAAQKMEKLDVIASIAKSFQKMADISHAEIDNADLPYMTPSGRPTATNTGLKKEDYDLNMAHAVWRPQ